VGSGRTRTWFRCKIEGERGREICRNKRDAHLLGPEPFVPGCLGEFIESVWWPRTKPACTTETLRRYTGILSKWISPFYAYQVESLRLEVLQKWVSEIEAEPKTIRNIYGVMSGILELARKTGRYTRQDHKLVVLPSVVKKKRGGLEIENIRKLLEQSKGTVFDGPTWTAAWLGLRRNEVCGLKVGDVEIKKDSAIVTIRHNRQKHGETMKLKSKPAGVERVLHLPKWMGEKLLSYREPDSIYLFMDQGKPIHPDKITEAMPGLCKKAGIPQLRFHDLRHACRSNLSAAGVSDVIIMSILGHSTFEASLIYQHESAARQVEAFDRLASL
jgi:integrase